MTERLPSGVRFNITYTRYDSLFSSLIRGFFLEILCYFSLLKNQRLKFLFNLESMGEVQIRCATAKFYSYNASMMSHKAKYPQFHLPFLFH